MLELGDGRDRLRADFKGCCGSAGPILIAMIQHVRHDRDGAEPKGLLTKIR